MVEAFSFTTVVLGSASAVDKVKAESVLGPVSSTTAVLGSVAAVGEVKTG